MLIAIQQTERKYIGTKYGMLGVVVEMLMCIEIDTLSISLFSSLIRSIENDITYISKNRFIFESQTHSFKILPQTIAGSLSKMKFKRKIVP